MNLPNAIVVMGVAGVGKTTVGKELAKALGYSFIDADDYHSPENIKKMSAGIALTDEDREPWLHTLNANLREFVEKQHPVILACSALRQDYRDTIGAGVAPVWVYLKASAELIHERLDSRHGHYASANLLTSQLETLEEPTNAIAVDASRTPGKVVEEILARLAAG